MIINTNLASLNTTRQLGINEKNTQSSLAKLSSGLRINNAADDAAGLAISEKMRGQISGLNKASSNAQDGISLAATAEGSLNETTSILQRMRELAVQAGNDTNTTTDRTAMQTEMNQLTSEINRIGNTTEFNTQKLLNGGTELNANALASGKLLTGGLSNGVAAAATHNQTDGIAEVDSSATVTYAALSANNDTVVLNGLTFKTATTPTTYSASNWDVAVGGDKNAAATALFNAFTAAKAGAGATALANITATDSGTGVVTFKNTTGSNATTLTASAATASGNLAGGTVATKAHGDLTFTGVESEGSNIMVAGKKISFYDSAKGTFPDATTAKTAYGADLVVDTHGITTAAGMAAAVVNAVNTSPISGYTVKVDGTTPEKINIDATSAGATTLGSTNKLAIETAATATAASGNIAFSDVPTQDSKVTIGDSSFGFYDSTSGKYADAATAKTALGTDFVIDTNGLKTPDAIKSAVMAYAPQMTDVTLADGGIGKISVAAAATGGNGNKIVLDAPEKTTSGFSATLQIGANSGQTMVVEVDDMRSQALDISSNTGGTITAKNGNVATLTKDLSASNGSNNVYNEYTLDISSATKATAAISVLDDAINTVSAERSKLGAIQNRLEHTINNLGTSSQNITSAEANIRDVDMAKEMTNFQKNNILQQAAQAMLAQANQQPQGVLQLLR